MVVLGGDVLLYYMTDCLRNVALIRPLRGHLPPMGRLCLAVHIIERYNSISLCGVARAFPEGEGGPAQAGSDEGNAVISSPSQ